MGFSFRKMLHMRRPLVVILVLLCWGFFLWVVFYSSHVKIKSCNLSSDKVWVRLSNTTNDINYITVELHVSAYIEAIFRFSMRAKRYGGGGPNAEIS